MHPETLPALYEFLTETTYLAGRLTLGYFQTGLEAELKRDRSLVTIADRKSEELIRSRIEKHYPGHAIVGEEYGLKETEGATHRWFIDPIDGTRSFVHGVPLYAVLIGLEIEGQVQAGAAYFPGLDEMVAAADGMGCWWNGRRVRVSPVANLDQAVAVYTDVKAFTTHHRAEAWSRIQAATYFQAGWSDAYAHCLVATGRAEIGLDPVMNVWDSAPFPPILREAGGYFGDWLGNPSIYAQEALTTNQALLPQVLELIQGEKH